MQNGPLLFIVIAIALVAAMLIISRLMRKTAQRPLPGSSERRNGGTHWFAHRGKHDDDFEGDGDL
ncbi:MAG: hypothetical protein AAGF25_08595 [Pseudomonadota bacterium]